MNYSEVGTLGVNLFDRFVHFQEHMNRLFIQISLGFFKFLDLIFAWIGRKNALPRVMWVHDFLCLPKACWKFAVFFLHDDDILWIERINLDKIHGYFHLLAAGEFTINSQIVLGLHDLLTLSFALYDLEISSSQVLVNLLTLNFSFDVAFSNAEYLILELHGHVKLLRDASEAQNRWLVIKVIWDDD